MNKYEAEAARKEREGLCPELACGREKGHEPPHRDLDTECEWSDLQLAPPPTYARDRNDAHSPASVQDRASLFLRGIDYCAQCGVLVLRGCLSDRSMCDHCVATGRGGPRYL